MAGSAGTFGDDTRIMSLNASMTEPHEVTQTIAHEVMHWVWPSLPRETRERVRAHLLTQSAGRAGFTRRGIKHLGGDWLDPLAGRADGTEILPYYFEKLFSQPERLSQYLKSMDQRFTFNLMAEALQLKAL
jgi:hypothetical protein